MPCPCCSGKDYIECCAPWHDGAPAPDALALMRSRYSGYALQKADYIIATTHPKNRSYTFDLKKWKQDILLFCQNTQFEKLEILSFEDGKENASVTFVAHLTQQGRDATLKECSLFEKIEGRWLYKEGKVS